MKIIDFSTLTQHDFNAANIMVLKQSYLHAHGFSYLGQGRPSNCFNLILTERMDVITKSGEKTVTLKNDIVYLPEGSHDVCFYYHENPTNNPMVSCIAIEFNLIDKKGKPFILSDKITIIKQNAKNAYKDFYNTLLRLYNNPLQNKIAIKIALYQLLNEMCTDYANETLYSSDFYIIADGISYIENNIDLDFSIKELADMCHVSVSTFRRIFIKYSGVSPIAYKNLLRISKAKELLKNTHMSLSSIATMLGYCDASHFSKAFESNAGISPGKYRNKYL